MDLELQISQSQFVPNEKMSELIDELCDNASASKRASSQTKNAPVYTLEQLKRWLPRPNSLPKMSDFPSKAKVSIDYSLSLYGSSFVAHTRLLCVLRAIRSRAAYRH